MFGIPLTLLSFIFCMSSLVSSLFLFLSPPLLPLLFLLLSSSISHRLLVQMTILSTLRHPNILLFIGVSVEDDFVALVTSFMER